jgi:hypothetical protein
MIGLAAATAWTIVLFGVVTGGPIPGPSLFFRQLLTDVHLQIAVVGAIGCAFVSALLIAQGVILLLKAVRGRSS